MGEITKVEYDAKENLTTSSHFKNCLNQKISFKFCLSQKKLFKYNLISRNIIQILFNISFNTVKI
jgi:hypothetical protein